ncbi:c-type cytochrome [Occallatibacter riparius]|uniref:Cytochrome c n=1 Tax=Occallatibacter riparius TaxID=1002689 RepID=A0A9J7BKL1_9BACT|nr:cytochrome c [Occallatibacter riparius]UWZ83412.1 cytochrome c [Occallatibacter riparius]
MNSGIKFFPALLFLAATAAFAADTPADVKAGAALFRDKGCAFCHGADLKGTKKAPALADIGTDKDWPADKMTDHILNGGQKMPPFRDSLSDEEIAQLVAFLRAKDHPAPPPPAE